MATMASTSGRVIHLAGLLAILFLMVVFFHFYARSSFNQQSLDWPERHEMALDENDLEKLKPHFGHVLLEQRAQIKLKAAKRPKKDDPWAIKGEYKYPVEREIQQASPFPVLRPLAGPPPAGKKTPHGDFVEEPHRLLKPLPTFDDKGKLLYPNIEDEEPLNFEN